MENDFDWDKPDTFWEKKRSIGFTFLKKLEGRWRILFGFCPNCNSDAPKMYDCDICCWRHNYNGRSLEADRKYWWRRYSSFLDNGYTIRDVTGFDTIEEYDAYELGKRHMDELFIDYIQNWDGRTNSGIGEMLSKKLNELYGSNKI